MLKLQNTAEHVKNYRPQVHFIRFLSMSTLLQVLLLCGNPVARPALVDFASAVCKESSLLVCAQVLQVGQIDSLRNSDEAYRCQI